MKLKKCMMGVMLGLVVAEGATLGANAAVTAPVIERARTEAAFTVTRDVTPAEPMRACRWKKTCKDVSVCDRVGAKGECVSTSSSRSCASTCV